jgi:excisionase family DNA binding protein
MPDVLTIRECVQRAKAEGLPVKEYTLRRWIKTGSIPYRSVGKKVLIYYPNLTRHLMATDGTDHTPAHNETAAGIRRVEM